MTRDARESVACQHCGEAVMVPPSTARRKRFCSRRCQGLARANTLNATEQKIATLLLEEGPMTKERLCEKVGIAYHHGKNYIRKLIRLGIVVVLMQGKAQIVRENEGCPNRGNAFVYAHKDNQDVTANPASKQRPKQESAEIAGGAYRTPTRATTGFRVGWSGGSFG